MNGTEIYDNETSDCGEPTPDSPRWRAALSMLVLNQTRSAFTGVAVKAPSPGKGREATGHGREYGKRPRREVGYRARASLVSIGALARTEGADGVKSLHPKPTHPHRRARQDRSQVAWNPLPVAGPGVL